MTYTIRQADADDDADELNWLQDQTELPRAPYDDVNWWLTYFEGSPVGYLGIMRSRYFFPTPTAYLCRVGVLAAHRGNSLQLRMMRVAERAAKRGGIAQIVSDTRQNPASANNFIRAGYHTFQPSTFLAWAHADAIYWRKHI